VKYGSLTLPPVPSITASKSPVASIVPKLVGDLYEASKPAFRSCATITGVMSRKKLGLSWITIESRCPPFAQNPPLSFA
jgi:hypothetical protein